MKTIVTHPGQAHRDEFLSCCLLLAGGVADRIERRDATDEDLADPEVIVLDQGGRHEPERSNFDHHQFLRDAEPACSITLVLPELGIDPVLAREIWDWLEFSERMDSKGPFQTADHYQMPSGAIYATLSPVESQILRWFGEEREINSWKTGQGLVRAMERIGQGLLDYFYKVQSRLEMLGSPQGVRQRDVRGVRVLDASFIDRDDQPALALELLCQQQEKDGGRRVAITITQDERGDGLSLFRRGDDPRVDFSRVKNEPGVVFAHANGFVAKIAAGVDPWPLIEKAMVPQEAAAS